MRSMILAMLLGSQWLMAANAKAPLKPGYPNPPKLIVVLVIDQFRADYLTRFRSRFLPPTLPNGDVGGFRYLMENGAWFPHGQYDLLQNMTGPGHATILTGSLPYASGIPVNNWFNRKTKDQVYCSEDEKAAMIGHGKPDPHGGTSPRNLIGTTVGDELKLAGFPSRVVSIALKDRAAIFLGGFRADATLWFDGEENEWISSRFYFPKGELPKWVREENDRLRPMKGKGLQWEPSAGNWTGFTSPFTFGKASDFRAQFPHQTKIGNKEALNTPYGLEVTEKLVTKAMQSMKLGSGKATDLLAVSLSTHDFVVHEFGPNSLEAEEITVSDDRTVSRLLNTFRKSVSGGLKNVLVVLTADHGIPSAPEYLESMRVPNARIDEKQFTESMEGALVEKLGRPNGEKWIYKFVESNVYLYPDAVEAKDGLRAQAEQTLKEHILKTYDSIAHVLTSTDYDQRKLPPGNFGRQAMNSYYPGRSGDLIVIGKPFVMGGKHATTHISGYSYDTTVPILFSGPSIAAGVFATQARVIDIAPTLSFLLGIIPPAQSEGRVLYEILKK